VGEFLTPIISPEPLPNSPFSSTIATAISNYQPSPNDGKFALDLLHALQSHLPLTFLQKCFIFTLISIPVPVSWKMAFFEFLYDFNWHSVPLVGLALLTGIAVLYLIRLLVRQQLTKREKLGFLELTFPSNTNKTAHATEQLFSLIHSLAGQRRFIHKLVGVTKRYSLELVATKNDGIRYVIAVSDADAPVIAKSLLAYLPGINIQQINDYLPVAKDSERQTKSRIIELQLRRDFALPLQTQKLLAEHDSIAYLTGNMTKLQENELLAFQTVITPVSGSTHRKLTKRIEMLSRRLYHNQPLANDVFASPLHQFVFLFLNTMLFIIRSFATMLEIICSVFVPGYKWEPAKPGANEPSINNPVEAELRTKIKEKIDQPLYQVSIRLLILSNDAEVRRERTAGFLAVFGPLATANQSLIQKTGLILVDWRSRINRFRLRQLSLFGNPVLTPSELTDIYHFPYTNTTKTEDMRKLKSPALPAPLSFKHSDAQFDNVFATNSYGGSETQIGLTLEERRRHTYILGATGSGKTTLLSTMIYQDILNGKGVAVIDPHGQLVEQLLRVIPHDRIKDVVWFAPDDDAFPVAVNLLDLPTHDGSLSRSQLEKQKSLVSSSLLSIFQKFYDAKFFGPRMEYVLRNAILTALETPDPTLVTILDLLTNNKFRKQILSNLTNPVLKNYWLNEFEKLGQLQRNSIISPITNKVGGLLSSPINYAILSQPRSSIDFEEVMNSGKILLCDLSKGKIGEDASSFFGSLILTKLQLAALARARIPESQRRDFYLYVDEFQNFATPSFAELVSEARKYRLSTILAHQSISQIENRDLVKIILANVGTVICFKTANPEDEQFILPIFLPQVAKHEISNLPLYTFYMKVSVGQSEDAFMAMVNNFTVKGSDETAQAAIDASRMQYGTSQTDTQSAKSQPLPHVLAVPLALDPIVQVIAQPVTGKRRL
jgi:hypothetical protein